MKMVPAAFVLLATVAGCGTAALSPQRGSEEEPDEWRAPQLLDETSPIQRLINQNCAKSREFYESRGYDSLEGLRELDTPPLLRAAVSGSLNAGGDGRISWMLRLVIRAYVREGLLEQLQNEVVDVALVMEEMPEDRPPVSPDAISRLPEDESETRGLVRLLLAINYCWRLGEAAAIVEEVAATGREPEVGVYPEGMW